MYGDRTFVLQNAVTGDGVSKDPLTSSAIATNVRQLDQAVVHSLVSFTGYGVPIVSAHPAYGLANGYTVDSVPASKQVSLQKQFKIDTLLLSACVSSRKYGGSYIIMVPDSKNYQNLMKAERPDGVPLARLLVAERHELVYVATEVNLLHPNFGLPSRFLYYPNITPGGQRAIGVQPTYSRAVEAVEVHHSWMIYVPPSYVSEHSVRINSVYPGFEVSALDRAYEAIVRNLKIDSETSVQMLQLNTLVLTIAELKMKQTAAAAQRTAFEERIEEITQSRALLNAIVQSPEDKAEVLTGQVSGFEVLSRRIERMLATATRIPRSILFCDADGGVGAKGSDELNLWLPEVQLYQSFVIKPALEQLYEAITGKETDVTMNSPEVISTVDAVNAGLSLTNQAVVAVNAGLLSREQVRNPLYAKGSLLARNIHSVDPNSPLPELAEPAGGGNLATSNTPKEAAPEIKTVDPQKTSVE